MTTIRTKKWGTIRECADHFKVSRQRVWTWVKDGRVGKTKKVEEASGTVWYIHKPFQDPNRWTGGGRPPDEKKGVKANGTTNRRNQS